MGTETLGRTKGRAEFQPPSAEELDLLLDRSDLTWAKLRNQEDALKSVATNGNKAKKAKKESVGRRRSSKRNGSVEEEEEDVKPDPSQIFRVVDTEINKGLQSINN